MKKLLIIIGIFFFTINLAWSEECCSVDAGFEGLSLQSIKKKLKADKNTSSGLRYKKGRNLRVNKKEGIRINGDIRMRSMWI